MVSLKAKIGKSFRVAYICSSLGYIFSTLSIERVNNLGSLIGALLCFVPIFLIMLILELGQE